MGLQVGLICEGSHDFNVIEQFIQQICKDVAVEIDGIDCLQPSVSATFQTSDGGWTRVKSWCETSAGKFYRQYLDAPLFATSKQYDLLIVHVDGDVAEICEIPPLAGLKLANLSPENTVSAIKKAVLETWLSLEDAHVSRVITCVPVRHMESWLLTCLQSGAKLTETRSTKHEFKTGPAAKYAGHV